LCERLADDERDLCRAVERQKTPEAMRSQIFASFTAAQWRDPAAREFAISMLAHLTKLSWDRRRMHKSIFEKVKCALV
jgi:hypothetical protein